MILIIDNYDSFTYNIVQYCKELGADINIRRNDQIDIKSIKKLNPDKIIISPGPSTPENAGICLEVIKEFQDSIPILGICLGHQSIAQAFGASIIRANYMMHGKSSIINITDHKVLFNGLPAQIVQGRYHSLVVDKLNLPNDIIITSYSADDKEIMSLKIKDKDIYGIQFHPESVMSEYGHEILNNFIKL